jgi:hypothetical protein
MNLLSISIDPPKPQTWLITFHNDTQGKWRCRFDGHLNHFQIWLIRILVGWSIEPYKP